MTLPLKIAANLERKVPDRRQDGIVHQSPDRNHVRETGAQSLPPSECRAYHGAMRRLPLRSDLVYANAGGGHDWTKPARTISSDRKRSFAFQRERSRLATHLFAVTGTELKTH